MTSLAQLDTSAFVQEPADGQVVASIRAGKVFTCLLVEEPGLRRASLEAVINSVVDLETRIVRVANPLRAPLTIERILYQAAIPAADARIERDPALLAAALATRLDDETRLLLAVEQPQTIESETMQILHAMRPYLEQANPRVQFLFAGPPAFAALMPPDLPQRPTAEPVAAVRRHRRDVFVLAAAVFVLLAVAAASDLARGQRDELLATFLAWQQAKASGNQPNLAQPGAEHGEQVR